LLVCGDGDDAQRRYGFGTHLVVTKKVTISLTHLPLRPIMLSFAAGVLLTALATLVVPALAQAQVPSASPTPIAASDVQQMTEWCRQMMAQAGGMMQGMMSGLCMGR
jgi:hypothetical protein